MSDIFFHVQHLLGIGHLKRAAVLANACAELGLSVTLASGGRPVPTLALDSRTTLLQLPALTVAPVDFKRLLTPDGQQADPRYRERRLAVLLDGFRTAEPQVLVTELFPFGRRQLRHELLALLDTARNRQRPPRIVCSIRDILQERTAGRRAESLDWALAYYDRILVHGDPALVPLDRSFPETTELGERLRYTGYIAQGAPPAVVPSQRSGVVVSCGGGAVGQRLLDTALAACRELGPRLGDWLILIGEGATDERLASLRRGLPDWVEIEGNRPDFLSLLTRACLSISQAGYNSVVDLLAAQVPAVLVPYAGGEETEQTTRAAVLARYRGFESVEEEALTPATLHEAVCAALAENGKPERPVIDLCGARTGAALLQREARGAICA